MVSIIISIYQEEKGLGRLFDNIAEVLEKENLSYEILCIDDGNREKILQYLIEEIGGRKNVLLIRLARNFGQTATIEAGLAYAKGDVIVTMDGDLQNDPVDIPRLLSKLREGYDVVVGWRRKRSDPLLTRKIPSYVGNKLISKITGLRLHDYGCGLKAFRKGILKDIQFWGEIHRILPVYAALNGAKMTEIEVSHHPRKYGKSKYSIFRGFKLIVDLMTFKFIGSFGSRPNYLFGISGLLSFAAGFFFVFMTLLFKIEKGLLMTLLFTILGFQLLIIGLFSEILMRIYHLIRQKPTYIIKEVIEGQDAEKRCS